ncbi:retrovirus-related pol polyprotein from transposon TNT 1-94 [Tanacetum coccineum]
MSEYYEDVGIFHQKSVPRTPQQNSVVERRNRTLVEAARTMMIFSKAPMFLWAEAVATACYTQNRSLIHTRHNKTPYELVHDKKPDLTFLRVFGALCYPTNDSEDLGKFKVLSFLEIDWLAGHQRSKEARQYQLQRLNTSPCLDVVLKSFGCDHSSKTTDLTSIKFLCTLITRVLLLFAVTMSSTLDQNTLTYGTISSESKWKIEWLNSTSWKQIINLQTFSPKYYQENGSNFFFHA